jgi:hypothetical protein
MRTVHTLPADCPRATCATWTVRDLRADGPPNLLPQNFGTSNDQRASSQELNEHAKDSHLAAGPRATGGQSTNPRTEQPKVKTEKSTFPIPPWISQTAWALEERFGGDVKRPQGMLCPKTWVLKLTKLPGVESPPNSTKNLGSN